MPPVPCCSETTQMSGEAATVWGNLENWKANFVSSSFLATPVAAEWIKVLKLLICFSTAFSSTFSLLPQTSTN